jgi:hypothetical protein
MQNAGCPGRFYPNGFLFYITPTGNLRKLQIQIL